jgi:hypothetical protein
MFRLQARLVAGIRILTAALLCLIAFRNVKPLMAQESPKFLVFLDPVKTELKPDQEKILQQLKKEKTAAAVDIVRVDGKALKADFMEVHYDRKKPSAVLDFKRAELQAIADDGFRWFGKCADSPLLVRFTVRKDRAYGTFQYDRYVYDLRPLGGGLHVLIKRDPRKAVDHPPEFKKVEEKAREKEPKQPEVALADSPTARPVTITVMVLYTANVAARHAEPMREFVAEKLIDPANESYARSRVPIRLELVHVEQVAYCESGFLAMDVARLADKNDGKMDEIHKLRDKHKADLVMLLIAEGDAAGYASAIHADEHEAFAAMDDEYDWYFTFAHELGHLFGCRHNPESDSSTHPHPHGHGFLQEQHNPYWRTIMAYDCSAGCTRVGVWSNPNVVYEGQAAGTAGTHDNARVMRERAPEVAGFRK